MAREGHRLFAALYDRMTATVERRWMGKRREVLLAAARGEVLGIGIGTGANLPHYHYAERLTLSEPDSFMREKLWPKLGAAGVPVKVSDAGAESLPFPDDAFDTMLCTVPDQRSALREVRRVLRPGGPLPGSGHTSLAPPVGRVPPEPRHRRRYRGSGVPPRPPATLSATRSPVDPHASRPGRGDAALRRLRTREHVLGSARR